MVLEEMWSEEFQYGCCDGHLGYQNGTILAILNLYVIVIPPSKFLLNSTQEEISLEEFQDGHHGSHFGYRNRMVLAILNLYVAPMPPVKFRLNPT